MCGGVLSGLGYPNGTFNPTDKPVPILPNLEQQAFAPVQLVAAPLPQTSAVTNSLPVQQQPTSFNMRVARVYIATVGRQVLYSHAELDQVRSQSKFKPRESPKVETRDRAGPVVAATMKGKQEEWDMAAVYEALCLCANSDEPICFDVRG